MCNLSRSAFFIVDVVYGKIQNYETISNRPEFPIRLLGGNKLLEYLDGVTYIRWRPIDLAISARLPAILRNQSLNFPNAISDRVARTCCCVTGPKSRQSLESRAPALVFQSFSWKRSSSSLINSDEGRGKREEGIDWCNRSWEIRHAVTMIRLELEYSENKRWPFDGR